MRLKAFLLFAIVSVGTFSVPAWGQGTTKIGVIKSLTGSLAAFGEAHKNGYAIAFDAINAKGGGQGKKGELDCYDDHGKRDHAAQDVSKLVDPDQEPGLFSS